MAKRKKRYGKKTSRRRSRVGAAGGQLTDALAMVAGAVIGRVVSSKLSTKVNPKILAGGQIVLGMYLPKLVKNKFASGIGAGMIVNGGVQALTSFGVISAISGIGQDMQIDYVSGDDMEMDDMSGSADIQEIAGMEDSTMGLYDEGIMSGSSDIAILAGDDEYDY